MRYGIREQRAFIAGVTLSVLALAVTFVTIGAARRALQARASSRARPIPFIDGVHPPNEVELDLRPQEEANLSARLASEAIDVPPVSQRW